MDSRSNKAPPIADIPFEDAVLKAKVAQICDQIGYNAITKDSVNILVDIYRRTIIHLARHCKEAANNNRRIEPTLMDLVQAYDFVGISIPELKEHVENVKLPFDIKIESDERHASNRIHRNMHIDDLLEAEKNTQLDDHDDGIVDKALSDSGIEEEERPSVPLLKDVFQEISKQSTGPSVPIKADKVKIKREEKPAIPRLKITPLDPSVAEPPSFLPILENIKHEPIEDDNLPASSTLSSVTVATSKRKTSKAKTLAKSKIKTKTKAKTKSQTKLKTKLKKKPKTKTKAPSPIPTPPLVDVKPIFNFASTSRDISSNATTTTNTTAALPQSASTPTPPIPTPPVPQPPPHQIPSPFVPLPNASATPPPTKSGKNKKKKKKSSNNQFAIVTESVAAEDDKEWLCPACSKPDDGDLMLMCDTCEEWYHLRCTSLKKIPKDNESWDCVKCVLSKQQQSSIKSSRKRSQTPVEVPVKTKTPDPPTPAPQEPTVPDNDSPPPKPSVATTSQDDLCPECHLPDDGTLMIQCDDPFCAKWFHGKCVSVLEEPKEDESWFCTVCVDKQQSAFKRRRRAK